MSILLFNPLTGKFDIVRDNLSDLAIKDHHLLDGLLDNDHTQYPLRAEWLQNGFPNLTDSAISFSDGNRRFTINPSSSSFDYFIAGVKYTVSSSDVVNVNYIDLTDTEGDWWIYYDGSTLIATRAPSHATVKDIYENKAVVAIVFWDADNSKGQLVEDRHGISMSPLTHVLVHETVGTRFDTGLALNTITVDQDGSADSHAQFGVDAGQIFDEDIEHTLNAIGSTTGLQIWYQDTSGWMFTTNAGFSMVTTGSGRLAYDNSGTLTEVTDGKFVLCHVFATSFSHLNPVVAIGQAEYATKKLAQQGALTEIANILSIANISPELKPLASVIFQTKDSYTNSVNARIVSTDTGGDYVDFRTDILNPASATAQDHGNLGGLDDDDHVHYHNETRHDVDDHSGLLPLSHDDANEISNVSADDHHSQSHNAASHSDIAETGANIDAAVAASHAESHALDSHSSYAHGDLSDAPASAHHSSTSDGLAITPASVASAGAITIGADNALNISVKARAYLGASQLNLTSGNWTKVLLNGETYDVGGDFASYQFVAPVTGYYQINAVVNWSAAAIVANKRYIAAIYVDGASVAEAVAQAAVAANSVTNVISDCIYLVASSYIELYAIQISGANTVDIQGGSRFTYMSIHLLSV